MRLSSISTFLILDRTFNQIFAGDILSVIIDYCTVSPLFSITKRTSKLNVYSSYKHNTIQFLLIMYIMCTYTYIALVLTEIGYHELSTSIWGHIVIVISNNSIIIVILWLMAVLANV